MKKLEAYITLEDGKMAMQDKGKFFDCLRTFPNGLYRMVVEFVYDARTSPQNRYYWGVVVKAYVQGAYDTWGELISSEEAHETLKALYNFEEKTNEDTGEIIRVPRSTAELETMPFWEYVERCRRHIQEWFSIETPDPKKK